MIIEDGFDIARDPDAVWEALNDTDAVVACLPGVEISETIDDSHWRGSFDAKLGPVALTFVGNLEMVERDDRARRLILAANGRERRGKGTAEVAVTVSVETRDGTTSVHLVADLTLKGPAVQLGRGLIPGLAARLTRQFASCLEASIGVPS